MDCKPSDHKRGRARAFTLPEVERGIYAASLDSPVGAALCLVAVPKPPVKRHKCRAPRNCIVTAKQARAGFTLPEVIVAVGLSSILILGAVAFYLFSIKSFASMLNYTELHQKQRRANDLLTRDLRCARAVNSATTSNLVLQAFSGSDIRYTYDAVAGTLTRSQGTNSETVLKEIDSLTWTLYQRPATNATFGAFQTTTNPASAKLVTFSWVCSKELVGNSDSEILQAGKVELRNQ